MSYGDILISPITFVCLTETTRHFHSGQHDKDLSLRGFLKHEMLNVLGERKDAA
jgi:hypothetical protein